MSCPLKPQLLHHHALTLLPEASSSRGRWVWMSSVSLQHVEERFQKNSEEKEFWHSEGSITCHNPYLDRSGIRIQASQSSLWDRRRGSHRARCLMNFSISLWACTLRGARDTWSLQQGRNELAFQLNSCVFEGVLWYACELQFPWL